MTNLTPKCRSYFFVHAFNISTCFERFGNFLKQPILTDANCFNFYLRDSNTCWLESIQNVITNIHVYIHIWKGNFHYTEISYLVLLLIAFVTMIESVNIQKTPNIFTSSFDNIGVAPICQWKEDLWKYLKGILLSSTVISLPLCHWYCLTMFQNLSTHTYLTLCSLAS